jgi:hypothetical protein
VILLPGPDTDSEGLDTGLLKSLTLGDSVGPAGWNASILKLIS